MLNEWKTNGKPSLKPNGKPSVKPSGKPLFGKFHSIATNLNLQWIYNPVCTSTPSLLQKADVMELPYLQMSEAYVTAVSWDTERH